MQRTFSIVVIKWKDLVVKSLYVDINMDLH